MQLQQKQVTVGEDREPVIVTEAGWDYSFRFNEIEKELQPKLDDPNQSETFKFFLRNFYSLLAACTLAPVPTPEEAFAWSRLYLDNWYLSFWELNEDLVGSPCPKMTRHEEVIFRDESKVFVWESHGLPSFSLKWIELEQSAIDHPLHDDPLGQMFVTMFYPKMAASCNGSGNIPAAQEVRYWPQSEIQKWLEASRRMNPTWYGLEGTKEESEEEKSNKKKKVKQK